jgi:hypothetical protein
MIADHYLQLRIELETALAGSLKLSSEANRDRPWLDTLRGLLKDIREPLLIVVVGEAKSGKSSLLNAFFGQKLVKVDVQSATDRIYVFRYGPEEKSVEISAQLTERYLPLTFLHDFTVVDTPETNITGAEHQKIIGDFVSSADLVLLVFSVVNPWTQSFLDFLGSWREKWLKNAVFVLQQADQREPKELDIIRRHLEDTAMKKIGFTPPIFAVSARSALLAQGAGLDAERLRRESQFGPLEEQINLVVMQSGGRTRKLRSTCQTAQLVLHDVSSELRASLDLIAHDEKRLARVEALLQARKEQTLRLVTGFLRQIGQAYYEGAAQGVRLLKEKLSFAQTWKILRSRLLWRPELQMEMEMKLRQSVGQQVEQAVQSLETDLRGLWPQLHDITDRELTSDLKTQVPRAIPDFARQRRALLQSIQLALNGQVSGKTVEEQLAQLCSDTSTLLRLSVSIVAGCGIAALLAIVTGAGAGVADISGVLAASVGIIGTVVTLEQRRTILRIYKQDIEARRVELLHAIGQQLNQAIDLFYGEALTAFQPLAAFCVVQRQASETLLHQAAELQRTFAGLASRLH